MFWKILNLGIIKSYGFNNGSYIEYQIWERKVRWSERDTIAESFCKTHGIRREDEMHKLENKKFEILDQEDNEDGSVNYLVRLINKKINPHWKTFWLFDYGF